jgi:hypothetical protein
MDLILVSTRALFSLIHREFKPNCARKFLKTDPQFKKENKTKKNYFHFQENRNKIMLMWAYVRLLLMSKTDLSKKKK